jgi:hypothetical protein
MRLEILEGGSKIGEFFLNKVESIPSHAHVYGNEKATKYQNILGKGRLFFSLPQSSLT